ncbi:MAG: glutamate racemase [Chloroflexi bacterium]|nr:glutamate racemase [Chloroflexota bacterium]
MSDQRPIGVFDSGVGGLSVWRELAAQLPLESTIYFADIANCPYGPRSNQEIQALAQGIVGFLAAEGAKLIVVACNTASAASLAYLRSLFSVPIVGMVPAVKPAAAMTASKRVGVIATEATVQGQVFAELVERFANGVEVYTKACPGLVQQVERGELEGPETRSLLQRYLDPLLAQGIDTLVLGCTHYPFLEPAIRRVVGPDVIIIDPSPAVVRQTGRVLEEKGLQAHPKSQGEHLFYTTGDPSRFREMIYMLLGISPAVRQALWQGAQLRLAGPTGPPGP